MKIYLLEDVKGKGKKGDIVEVSDGYGRNFLIPKKLGKLVDAEVLSEKKSKDDAAVFHREQEILHAKKVAKVLDGGTVEIKAKAGANGKLFGSITSKEVATAIKNLFNVDVDKKKIDLPEIKQFGTFNFVVKIYHEILANMKVFVTEEQS